MQFIQILIESDEWFSPFTLSEPLVERRAFERRAKREIQKMNAWASAIQRKKLSGERVANLEKMSECPALLFDKTDRWLRHLGVLFITDSGAGCETTGTEKKGHCLTRGPMTATPWSHNYYWQRRWLWNYRYRKERTLLFYKTARWQRHLGVLFITTAARSRQDSWASSAKKFGRWRKN